VTPAPTPFERIGGEAVLRRVVDRFYDLMESDPDVAPLRAMHAADLGPMRERLHDYMITWTGGPPVYHQRKDAKCMPIVHAPFAIDESIRRQWLSCMHRALEDCGVDADVQRLVRNALERMTGDMLNR
jgi:hemoglobin